MMMSALASPTSFANTNTFSSSVHANHHPRAIFAVSPSIFPVSPPGDLTAGKLRRYRKISCEVALKSDSAAVDSSSCSSSSSSVSSVASSAGEENEESGGAKIGARVRVTAPLKVYHVPKVPELDITGMEGQLKAYVGLWKGKRISANLPFKIEFVTDIEGRGKVKFSAHLKEDEFEYVD